MRILHCCLAATYCDNYHYQENVLSKINKNSGHDVEIIASTSVFLKNGESGYTEPKKYVNENGIIVVRLPYSKLLPTPVMNKLRIYKGLYEELCKFNPDVILCHGGQMLDLFTIRKYVKKHPNVVLYIDNHADKHNSASNWVSKYLLHKGIYKFTIRSTAKYVRKFLYITWESKEFLKQVYKIPEDKLEYYPLGGILFDENDRKKTREEKRRQLGISEDDILCIHSGKLTEEKKTKELLEVFNKVSNPKIKLVIIGMIQEEYKPKIMPLIEKNSRITYLGWKSGEELQEYLCAGDLYIQPGSQSATMQNAVCCGCVVAVSSVKSHTYLLKDAAFYIDNKEDLYSLLNSLQDKSVLDSKREKSMKVAEEKLDYQKLADRLTR